ncbi:poly A polymerase C-terminal region-like protein [Lojkania enalia]|uniref:Poly A polymerase C-terminal region-like protein n=1 Tax=Lojkania enalia TaxID=147567 RepID=A0A9P4N175_9PLEO|nr:poly A polymerase C-terminal region-like protein [Didymosphaeria enalia]
MASQSNSNPTTLQLTEVETKVRQLLLDVAAFIDETSESEVTGSASEVKVPDELAQEKVVLRFTGGWVRDKLLNVGSQDIDVAINKMTGEHFGLKMIEYLKVPGNAAKYGLEAPAEEDGSASGKEKAGNGRSRRVTPGLYKIDANPDKSKHLETCTTNILGLDIDLVNLRKEVYTADSRNPQVEFGTPEEDAMRRDATVNAMFFNLNTSQIEDFTGRGFEDMAAKIIRTPLEPYQTFKDDPLRILRLIRFASRLGYTIDPEAKGAMGHEEILETLKIKISRERVGIETEKMLKGPDPHMALALIDELGLYETVYTDPTREFDFKPEISWFAPAYSFIKSVVGKSKADIPTSIPGTLLRNSEEHYLAWISAALMPWADAPLIPHQKPTQRPHYAAQLVAREGIKAPNKVVDVVTASLRFGEDIRRIVDQCYRQLRRPDANKSAGDATARDTLGMAIRRWGPSWRSQVLFSLTYEIVLGSISRESILRSYSTFLNQVTKFGISEAYTFKPLLTGTELAKALNTKPGPWMKDALDVVMAWQLQNPETSDPTEAIKAIKATRNSELSSRLASHFLQLTIRPLFSPQNKPNPNLTPAGHKASVPLDKKAGLSDNTSAAPWKTSPYAIDLLRWTLSVLDTKGVEANWGLLIPPILKMMDDLDLKWKATGCDMLTFLLKHTPLQVLSQTGLGNFFEEELWPLFTYLPTLTPEQDSLHLLSSVFPALISLLDILYPASKEKPTSSLSTPRERFIDRLLRDGILAPLFHAPPPMYPKLATSVLTRLPPLLTFMGIDSVKHLHSLLPFLSNILAEPLGPAYPPLMLAAAKGMQAAILNGWPRISGYRGEITRGVAVGWVRCVEENEENEGNGERKEVSEIKEELRECVGMLEAVLKTDEEMWAVWLGEKKELTKADERVRRLFEE